MIGISITVTLKDAEKERTFLEIFQEALKYLDKIEGLKDFKAAKIIGVDHSYHIFSLWESEEKVEKWLNNPNYKEIRKNSHDLIKEFVSYRWSPLREPKILSF
ncbi:MAG: antibiotic biosynthesis monooxygenase family protein [Thermoanaerobaculia bacterium]